MIAAVPFLFIVGSPRSGSTLMRAILDGHSRLAIPPESHFIATLAADRRFDSTFKIQRYLRILGRSKRFGRWDLTIDEVATAVGTPTASLPDAVRRTFGAYAAKQGKDRYGDKTPGYALHVKTIAELFPEAVFVHLVRDGRDVAASLLDAPFGPSDIEAAAVYWSERVETARSDGSELGSDRYLEVRYEDLVDTPEVAVRAVCGLADLAFEVEMLDHRVRAERIIRSTTDPQLHTQLAHPMHRARDWRQELAADEVARFEAVARTTLLDSGYELSGS